MDIYAFGMVVLEIVTKEYPYSECTNQAQIYRKVTSGIKPNALLQITDDGTRNFIETCIHSDPKCRPSAAELLHHPFLSVMDVSLSSSSINIFETSSSSVNGSEGNKSNIPPSTLQNHGMSVDPSKESIL